MAETPPIDVRDFDAGSVIFRENETGHSMFVVLSGSVQLVLAGMNVETVTAGGFLGEMSLLQDQPRTTTALAETACSLQELDAQAFLQRVMKAPFFATKVIRTMARRIRNMDRHVSRDTRFTRTIAETEVTPALLQSAKAMITVNKGAFILRQNEDGNEMYCIRRGKVELRVNDVVVETVGVGGIVGELALLDNKPRSATAVAAEDCDLLVYDTERFEYLLAMTPEFTFRIMQLLARRLRAIDRAIARQY
jgi:CRP/FNR family transcriptional regulator, cyclic AMP receptor protein